MVRRLLLLNGLAALMLALHHATGYGFSAMFDWTDRYMPVAVPNYDQIGTLPYYAFIIIQQLDYFALPAFMFVSGFFVTFLIGNKPLGDQFGNIKTRLVNLLIPFLLWSVVFFILFVRRLPDNADEILDRYHYIPLVMQFYIISPLLIPLARKNWKLFLTGAVAVELFRFSIRYVNRLGIDIPGIDLLINLTPRWMFPMLFSWFALGIVGNLYREQLMRWLPRYKWPLLAATILLAISTMVEYTLFARAAGTQWLGTYFGGYTRHFYALAFILCFLAFEDSKPPLDKQISSVGGKSLGIYLAHSRLMYVAAVIMYQQTPWILGNQFLYQMVLVVVALGGSLLLMEVVKKTPARRYYKYIFG